MELKDPVSLFMEYDLDQHTDVYSFAGLELFLMVLRIAKLELGVDGLTPSEIAMICTEKLMKSEGVHRSTISATLSNATPLAKRIDNPRGRGYAYRLMPAGEKHLKDVKVRRSYR